MAVSLLRTSRLLFSTLRNIEDKQFFTTPDLPAIEPADDDIVHIIEDTDRIDLLSNRYYGTPRLGWVIMRANNLQLIPRDLKLRKELLIPTRRRVFTEILAGVIGA